MTFLSLRRIHDRKCIQDEITKELKYKIKYDQYQIQKGFAEIMNKEIDLSGLKIQNSLQPILNKKFCSS